MKKSIIKILLAIFVFSIYLMNTPLNTYADGIKVIVTEKIPGANCSGLDDNLQPVTVGGIPAYECTVQKGFGAVTDMMGEIIKYFTFIATLAGVLFIIVNGITYSMGGIDQSMKDTAKKRITTTLMGLVLLFLSGVFLNMIAPWVYK